MNLKCAAMDLCVDVWDYPLNRRYVLLNAAKKYSVKGSDGAVSNLCTCHIDQDDYLYCLYYTPMERERDYWKQRALAAESKVYAEPTVKDTKPITKVQLKVLRAVMNHIEQQGYSPSVREITRLVGLQSSSTAFGHLDRLEAKGYIKRAGESGTPRNIMLTKRVLEIYWEEDDGVESTSGSDQAGTIEAAQG